MQPTIKVDTIFGRIEAFENDLITNQLISFGAHTRPDLAFLLSFVDQGDTIFDIGGHIGTFGIPLAQKAGRSGKVLIVEGAVEIFEVLSRNVETRCNGLNVEVLNALIVPTDFSGTWVMDEQNTGASYILASNEVGLSSLRLSLDRLSKDYFLPRVIKIDIEGFEWSALAESKSILLSKPIVYAEVCDDALRRAGGSIDSLDGLLLQNGYRFFINVGERNAANDRFVIREISKLREGGPFFDVLAIHRDDERLERSTGMHRRRLAATEKKRVTRPTAPPKRVRRE